MEIQVLEGVFDANEIIARKNRALLDERGAFMLNLMASPGDTLQRLHYKRGLARAGDLTCAVIEGDIAGKVDSEKIAATGVQAIQINTGGSCHLEAKQVNRALEHLDLQGVDLVIVENVGNLVCPAEFKLGEDLKVMILSVAEGHDKPLKYPLMFSESDVLIVNKMDLIPHTDFDIEALEETVLKMNPSVTIFRISCRTGEGLQEWDQWLKKTVDKAYKAT
jgi:hydrogenase nickel incorporation protein HypB